MAGLPTHRALSDEERGRIYGGLRKAWKGYTIARVQKDKKKMAYYSDGISKFKQMLEKKGVAKPMPHDTPQYVNGVRIKEGRSMVVIGKQGRVIIMKK